MAKRRSPGTAHAKWRLVRTRRGLFGLVPRRAVLTMALLTILDRGAAFAETAQPSSFAGDASTVATIVPGLADRGLAPTAVIDREEIERSGVRNLAELILNRASFNAFGLHRTFFLGSGAVMTMVNGQRATVVHPKAPAAVTVAPSGTQHAED